MPRRPTFGFVVAFALALTGLGCKQAVGERCEENSDCSSGLCRNASESAQGGRCCPVDDSTCGVTMTTPDADLGTAADGGDDVLGDASLESLSGDGAPGDGAADSASADDAADAAADTAVDTVPANDAADAMTADAMTADALSSDGSLDL